MEAPGNANTRLPFTVHMVRSGPDCLPDRLLYIPSILKPSGEVAVPVIPRVPMAWYPVDTASPRSPTGMVAPAAKPKEVLRCACAGVATAANAANTSALQTKVRFM